MYPAKALMLLTAFCAMLAFSGGGAQAQYTPNYTTSIGTTMTNSYYSPLATMNRADRERLYRRRSAGGNSSSNNHGGSGAGVGTHSIGGGSAARGSTTFRPVSSEPLIPHQMALRDANGSQERLRYLEKTFNETLQDYKAAVRAKGAPLNDVARVMSFFIANNYAVCNQGRSLTESQLESLRDYVHEVYLHDQKFQQMSAREKQEMYESLAIFGSIPMAQYLSGQQDKRPKLIAEGEQNARRLLQDIIGVPVERIRFTENGMEY